MNEAVLFVLRICAGSTVMTLKFYSFFVFSQFNPFSVLMIKFRLSSVIMLCMQQTVEDD